MNKQKSNIKTIEIEKEKREWCVWTIIFLLGYVNHILITSFIGETMDKYDAIFLFILILLVSITIFIFIYVFFKSKEKYWQKVRIKYDKTKI